MGKGGNDNIVANGGNDSPVSGDEGDDTLLGGDGFDQIAGGSGADTMTGGAQNDVIFQNTFESNQADGSVDKISCGPGDDDTAFISPEDGDVASSSDCENIITNVIVNTP